MRFPWSTGREAPNLLRYAPYSAGGDPADAPVRVLTPDGADFAIEDKEIVRHRDQCAGLYSSTEAIGTVRARDPVYLLRT